MPLPYLDAYLHILEEELLPAMGCTEPIAIALAAAHARALLPGEPDGCTLEVSGNIIKNVKSVTVPNTGGLKGLEAAAAAGIVSAKPELQLEVLSKITPDDISAMRSLLARQIIHVVPAANGKIFYIKVTLSSGRHRALCEITDAHTNITLLERDGETLLCANACADAQPSYETDRSVLSIERIVEFADSVDAALLRPTVGRQIAYNSAICEAGLAGGWGAEVGLSVLQMHPEGDLAARACALAAAGSDARMSGCDKPVVIVSGSGNQGITASMPVVAYAEALGASEPHTLRAVALADLVTIHQKTSIGRLSAFCGAVSAGCGAAAGIAYLHGGRYDVIAHTIANTLAICSGMICDGAKPSCAAKIAAAVNAGLTGYQMYLRGGRQFFGGEGIIKKGVENTISSVGRLARCGMRETDAEILDIMVGR